MSRLNTKDTELLSTGQNIDLSDSTGRYAYLGGEFTLNPDERDYVEVLIYSANEDFLESSIVDPEDYKFTPGQDIKLNTGTILRKLGYDRGRFIVKYNFLRKVAGSYENILVDKNNIRYTGEFDPSKQEDRDEIGNTLFIKEYKYYIHEISPSRKEVRLVSEFIQEPNNNQRYLRDFYDMQRTRKRVASMGDEDLQLKFNPSSIGEDPGQSLELGFVNPEQLFLPAMEQGTLMINKAFVTKVTTPELPVSFGAGSKGPPFEEIQSANLAVSFAIESDARAKVNITGDYALSRLKEVFKGRGMNDSTSDIDHIDSYKDSIEIMKQIQSIDIEHYQGFQVVYQSGQFQTIEIISNTQRHDASARTYTWEVFGWDKDVKSTNYRGRRTFGWDPVRVHTGTSGDVVLLADGYDGTAQQGLTWTDHDKVGEDQTSKIAIQLHSKDMYVGVRLTVENDLGQEDTLVIPAFLNTH